MELADCSTLGSVSRMPRSRFAWHSASTTFCDILTDVADGLDVLRVRNSSISMSSRIIFASHRSLAVADFGLVRDLRSGRPGAGASSAYSAPETFAGKLSPHCDQYSLAIVYQELLTGVRPFAGTAAEQFANQHLTMAPNLTSLSPADRSIVGRALAKKPGGRFSSCRAFVAALEGETIEERRSSRLSSILRPPSSAPAVVIGVGGVGGMVLRQLRRQLIEQIGLVGHLAGAAALHRN